MATIYLTKHKQCIAEFHSDDMQFERQDGGMLLTAQGNMVFQDTPSVENMLNAASKLHVTILKDGGTVIDQSFDVTVFVFEPDNLAMLLR